MSAAPTKGPARAIADLSTGTILACVDIEAPIERVFRALTSGDDIVKWWGSAETYRTTEWRSDLRAGGKWQARGVGANGVEFTVGGEFVEVAPPHRIVQTWKPDWDAGTTTLTYVLAPTATGTRLTLRHEGFAARADSCAAHSEGWALVLGWLLAHLAPPTPAVYFCSRLIPPRPNFPAGITPAEVEIMREHVAYWTGLLAQGKAIVFGPVADPNGNWGLGVLRVKDRAELEALQAQDPAIRSNSGFRHESLQMPQAIHG